MDNSSPDIFLASSCNQLKTDGLLALIKLLPLLWLFGHIYNWHIHIFITITCRSLVDVVKSPQIDLH